MAFRFRHKERADEKHSPAFADPHSTLLVAPDTDHRQSRALLLRQASCETHPHSIIDVTSPLHSLTRFRPSTLLQEAVVERC
jgi:hypothetical protein